MKIGIIIINYGNVEDTIQCVNSLERFYRNNRNINLILVDNNALEYLNDDFVKRINFKVYHIKNEENKGFAEGCNIGIERALQIGCDVVALINNDTIFIDDSLIKAAQCLISNSDIGIIGLINYYFDQPTKVWQSGFISKLNSGRTYRVNLNNNAQKDNEIMPVDYVPGSSIIIKSEVFKKIGLLDSKYFAYYEEYDFCIRTKKEGYKVGVLLESKILHKVGKSSISSVKLYLRTRNKLLLYKKYANIIGFFIASIKHIGISIFRIVFFEKTKGELFKAMIYGVKDYLNNNYYYGSLNKLKR